MNLLGALRRTRGDAAPPEPEQPAERTAADCRKEIAGVLTLYGWGIRAAFVVGGLALLFTMVNVQIFGSAGHQPGTSLESTFIWVISWLLDPMASIALISAIILEATLARYGRSEPWLVAVKWFAGLMTWAMNIAPALDNPHPSGVAAGVLLHSLAPGLVLGLAEAAPRVRRQVGEIIAGLEREAQAIEAREAAEAAKRQAEIERAQQEKREREEKARQAAAEAARQAAREEQAHQERLMAAALVQLALIKARQSGASRPRQRTTPAVRASRASHTSASRASNGRQSTPDMAALIAKARPLVAAGMGRISLADELGISTDRARKVIGAIRDENAQVRAARPHLVKEA